MPANAEKSLLSTKERERLLNRDSLDSHTRATNDIRVRKKLASWLRESADALVIFDYLPKDQLNKELSDVYAFLFLSLARRVMATKGFNPVTGNIKHPESWCIASPDGDEKPAEDIDIGRSWFLNVQMNALVSFYNPRNPIVDVDFLEKIDKHPKFHDRVTEDDRKGLERYHQALNNYKKSPEMKHWVRILTTIKELRGTWEHTWSSPEHESKEESK